MPLPEYNPPYETGVAITLTASAAVSAGDVLEVSGNGLVAPVTADASVKVIGVASNPGQPGDRLMIWGRGPVHELAADGIITAGDLVVASVTPGMGVRTATDDDNPRAVLGVAITSAASGALARWMET